MKGLPGLLASLVLLIICPLVGCASEEYGSINIDAASSLLAVADDGLAELHADIDKIDQQIYDVQLKLHKLDQVAAPALKWVETQKVNALKYKWSPRKLEVTKDLEKLKNDQYEVVKLHFAVRVMGSQYPSVIMIWDVDTGKQSLYEDLHGELKEQLSALMQIRENKLQTGGRAVSAARSIVDQYQSWTATKIDSIRFKISGPGLGREQGGIVKGEWTYYTDSGEIVPISKPSAALQRILQCK